MGVEHGAVGSMAPAVLDVGVGVVKVEGVGLSIGVAALEMAGAGEEGTGVWMEETGVWMEGTGV